MPWDSILSLVGVVVAALIGAATSRASNRSEERTKEVEARGPEWSAMMQSMQKLMAAQLEDRDKAITRLESKMSALEARLDQLGRKYRHALDHIRVLRHGHPDPPAVPETIADDV